jgi:steroid 5-alpha reductase family enzyme
VIALLATACSASAGTRAVGVTALTGVWAIRLGAHLFRRNFGQPEDRRYAAMRRHHGESFWLVSLASVFLLQAILMWVISLPIQWVALAAPTPLSRLDAAAFAVCAVGILFEAVGDRQLARFRADPTNRGAVMDKGLWRYTRHPNYFGDCVFWWGLFLFALNTDGGFWTVVSPLLMTTLLLRVSGVALLERTIVRRRPAYAAYIERTSAFVPWPPRSGGA